MPATTIHLTASWVVVAVCVGYGLAVWVVQLHRVVSPRDWLRERIWFIKAQTPSAGWNVGVDVERDLDPVEQGLSRPWPFVAVSAVQAGWRNVHGLEDRQVLVFPRELVDERLQTDRVVLETIPGAQAANFVKRIDAAFEQPWSDDPLHERASLLREVEVFRHNYRDTEYENLANLLGKAVWLSWMSLAIVVALAMLFGRESYFVFGAAGGLISRLTRVLRRRPTASDYGAEWSTLILSPAAGALAGWVGVAIAVALGSAPFNVLNSGFSDLWKDPFAPVGLVLAFVFGFSERLFDRLLGVATTTVGGALPKDDSASSIKTNDEESA